MGKTARAIIFKDNQLLVFFRRKIKDGKEITYYAIPGGHVEGNETTEETVIRELKEEMNLNIELLGYLGKLIDGEREEYYYHAKIVGGELQFGGEELERNSQDNYYEVRWLNLDGIDNSDIRSIDLIKKAMKLEYEDWYIFK